MAKQQTNKTKRLLAERMFVEEGMNAKEISDQLDISQQSLSKWRNEDDWDKTRDEIVAAPHKLRDILMKELKIVAEGGKSLVDADALAKINKVLETVSGRISVQVIFSVFKEFDNWMADQDPKTAVLFTEWHKQFLLYKINQEG
jgi:transposase-like protein